MNKNMMTACDTIQTKTKTFGTCHNFCKSDIFRSGQQLF
ncbi:hypothetical protein U14_04739 [Candidatus Moduliflexus flocculans]|uniref:Uncharacterized protein n=1 Tax=Candidatus Moduliflexus flocculans TaxID=1499966 RepID=A0A0S6W4P3_9BACT|nr:hypothetical protein U14_04739 [Candidatus Moduliflexus flocculans]